MAKWLEKHMKGVLVTPSLIFIILMIIVPLGYNFALSFTDWQMSLVKAPQFIGLANYKNVLHDERFLNSVWRTIVFSGIAIVIETILGVALAVLINRKFYGRRLVQALMLLPVVATPVAMGMVWQLILEPSIGIGNVIVQALGFAPRPFLATTGFESMFWLIMIDVWEWTPMVMLMVYGGLMTIPQDPYESALIDGANKWQTFTKITLPLASSSILIAVLMRLIDVVKTYDIIYATTQGGPSFATETINIYGYLNMFAYYRFGKAAAISVLFFIVVMGIGCGFLKVKSKVEVEY
ncbi:MAG: sugar ABC transporter permease [Clostridia bacterium]|nr:sugar ABC transporter permease [Clostridia bacterium]MBQ3487497.1 sugar ABC transporter permease [Clostridia bacterium]MBQ6866157.1 sugar ABC transporter permease [Clostridia bacterium]MBQ9322942.1 sugar ABC transporter permease [Clostridia bacterium]MBQ9923508.1 sugar ABC transporter permease [Clostridia bacterium]